VSGRRLALAVLALAALLAAALAGVAGPAAAKEFSIDFVDIDATVQPDGDLVVSETRTLTFYGEFSYVYWDLNKKGATAIDVRGAAGPDPGGAGGLTEYVPTQDPNARPPGTFFVADLGSFVRASLFFRLSDTSASFRVDYVARGAARRWDDVAELYWQFVGDQTPLPSGHVHVAIHLPKGVTADQVRAWAHGPLWGEVRIERDGSVTLSVDDLPENTFVEARVLFPATALARAPRTPGLREQAVLAEEQRLADEANRQRRLARFKVAAWTAGAVVPLAVAVVLVVLLYFRYGREPKPTFRAEYLRDVPQPPQPPAMAGLIWRMGGVDRDDFVATVLDLVLRGVIVLEPLVREKKRLLGRDEERTYRLVLRRERLEGLLPYERQLVDLLFRTLGDGDEAVVADLKKRAESRRDAVAREWQEWKGAVQSEGRRRRFFDPTADRMAAVGATVAAIAGVMSVAGAVFSGLLWLAAGAPLAGLLLWGSRAIRRRSTEAAELHAQLAALRRYLKDFGRLQEKPPEAVVLWEQFLVYATMFGIADEVVEALKVRLPEVVNDTGFVAVAPLWMHGPGGGKAAFAALHESFGEALSVASSSRSSGGGGGGGFSGGGGGGGGGGGFGAG